MRIGLNLLYLLPGVVGGTETYARELISALAGVDDGNEYVLFLNRECVAEQLTAALRFQHVVCPVAASSRGTRYLWEQIRLPVECVRHRIDALHSLGYVGPVRTPCAHVVTIHDTNFLERDVRMTHVRRATLGSISALVAHTADRVIAMSEFSRSEIVRRLRVPVERVQVVYEAPRTSLGPWRSQMRGGMPARDTPYVVAFAGSSQHKNIPRLVAAFARIADRVPHMLHLLGSLPAGGAVEREIARGGIADRISLRGYLSESEMFGEMQGADALAYPSLYEGFGLPVVDAQYLGVPVICSTAASLPEVAGSGAVTCDPRSASDIAATMLRVLTDERIRQQMIDDGTRNVARFSWGETARATIGIIESAARARQVSRG